MTINTSQLETRLCRELCASVSLLHAHDELIELQTPFVFPDGDQYGIYLRQVPGGVEVTDDGRTIMQLSYYMDVDVLHRPGNRARIFSQALAQFGGVFRDGELVVAASNNDLGTAVFRFGQMIAQVRALTNLTRSKVADTFAEDLTQVVREVVPEQRLNVDWVSPRVDPRGDYPVDFRFESRYEHDMFVFGVDSTAKARLTTITLQHFLASDVEFDSLVVFRDQAAIPKSDLARLTDVGGEQVSSLDSRDALLRKLHRWL